jgi:O-antigen ligase
MGIAVVLEPPSAAVFVGIAVAGWALWSPRTALVATLPVMMLPDLSGVGSSLKQGLAILFVLGWLAGLVFRRWRLHPVHLLIGAFALWLVFNFAIQGAYGVNADGVTDWQHDLELLLSGLALMAVAVSTKPSPRQLLMVFSVTTVAISIFTLTQVSGTQLRVATLDLNPNYLGFVIALGLVALFSLAVCFRQPLAWVGVAIALLALLTTHSRGAFIAAGFGLATVIITSTRPATRVALVAGAVAALLVFPASIAAVNRSVVGNRTQSELANNNTVRSQAAHLAIDLVPQHSIFGIGYGRFPATAQNDRRVGINIGTHDEYLLLAVETGIPGLLFMLALILPGLRVGSSDPPKRAVRGILATYLVGMLFADSLSDLRISAPLWLFLACCWVWRERSDRVESVETPASTNGQVRRRTASSAESPTGLPAYNSSTVPHDGSRPRVSST